MLSSTCNSILLKSNFKNKDILLNSFKIGAFYCIVCKLWRNANFPPNNKIPCFFLQKKKFSYLGFIILHTKISSQKILKLSKIPLSFS